jgi:hypothetical protein
MVPLSISCCQVRMMNSLRSPIVHGCPAACSSRMCWSRASCASGLEFFAGAELGHDRLVGSGENLIPVDIARGMESARTSHVIKVEIVNDNPLN